MKFIQLSRLKRASFQLAFEPDLKIIEIALQAGFDSQRHLLVHLSVHLIKLLELLEINQTGNLGTRSLFYDSEK